MLRMLICSKIYFIEQVDKYLLLVILQWFPVISPQILSLYLEIIDKLCKKKEPISLQRVHKHKAKISSQRRILSKEIQAQQKFILSYIG